MFQYYRKYIADIRYNNPDLKIKREAIVDGPLVGRIILVPKNKVEGEQILI
jgi:hypothetical protein